MTNELQPFLTRTDLVAERIEARLATFEINVQAALNRMVWRTIWALLPLYVLLLGSLVATVLFGVRVLSRLP